MIRAHRVNATAQDDASLITGWNIAPNIAYVLRVLPGPASCGILLYDATNVLIATGAALVGTEQPCVMTPQTGQVIDMVDSELGWHILLTTEGTESQREIHINPQVDIPDEIHPVYGDDDMALARATAAIDDASHYRDDVTVTCPLGLGDGLGDVASVPVDGTAVIGQIESITWTATPDGATEQAVIRRHVAIAPSPAPTPPEPPLVADDTGATIANLTTNGNVLYNDDDDLTIVAVNGLSANVGVATAGTYGGLFTVNSDGTWTFDPNGDFDSLIGSETAQTSVTYHASDGTSEAEATITITVERTNIRPVAVDDTCTTDAANQCGGNVLTNDTDGDSDSLSVSRVSGSAANVGVAVAGSNGGLFTIASNGAWTFDPNGEYADLTGTQTATTSVTYHASDWRDESESAATITVTVSASAGLEFIGSSTGVGNQYNYTVSLPAGAQQGDFVLVITGGTAVSDKDVGVVSPSGYTEIFDLWGNDSVDANLSVSYKFLGADPESSITVAGNDYDASYGAATIVMLFRGISTSTPLDVAAVSAVGSNSSYANPPAITPATDGAMIVAIGGWATAPSVSTQYPSGFANKVFAVAGTSVGFGVAACTAAWEGGSVDPGVFTPSKTSTGSSWCAATLALRPA